jgi:low temperature requirement protein LtrA
MHGLERLLIARDAYSYLHLPLIAGIILVALGVKKTLGQVDEPLKTVPAVALFGGIALYYAAHVAFRMRTAHTFSAERLVAALACLALIPIATEVDSLVALGLAAGVAALLITYESMRHAELRRRTRASASHG